MEQPFEKVYTMTDYWDGPRRGIADFNGQPHFYDSEWDDLDDAYANTFKLAPKIRISTAEGGPPYEFVGPRFCDSTVVIVVRRDGETGVARTRSTPIKGSKKVCVR